MSKSRPSFFKRDKATLEQAQTQLVRWYHSDIGRSLLNDQVELMQPWAQSLFGGQLLQISACPNLCLHQDIPVVNKACLSNTLDIKGCADAFTDPESLPFESNSIDVVLLHHMAEYTNNPHQLFKEIERVLTPKGHLLMISFNPWSIWGIYTSCYAMVSRNNPWRNQAISAARAEDWLRLLDFKVMAVKEGPYLSFHSKMRFLPKVKKLQKLARKFNLPGGAYYLVVAKKQVMPITPDTNRWRKALASLGARPQGLVGQAQTANEKTQDKPIK